MKNLDKNDKELEKEDSDNTKTLYDFINSQIPLGEEFGKVLYDNLWDLYVRS